MKKLGLRTKVSTSGAAIRLPSFRGQYLRISPLWAIWLGTLSTLTLGVFLFALHAMIGRTEGDNSTAVPEWKPPSLNIVALDPPKLVSADVESLSRPIFSKFRKPAPKVSSAITQVNGSGGAEVLTVTAIVIDKLTRQAFFISPDSPDGAWRKIGDTVDTWTITAITPKEVILQSGGQTTISKLYANIPAPNDDMKSSVTAPQSVSSDRKLSSPTKDPSSPKIP